MSTTKSNTKAQQVTSDPYQQAFERYRSERAALAPGALVPVRLNVPAVFGVVQAALPRIDALRAALVGHGLITGRLIDSLDGYSCALVQAHSVYVSETDAEPHELVSLKERAVGLRSTLSADAAALAARGLLDPARLAGIKHAGNNYRKLGAELFDLATLLLANWDALAGKTALAHEELETARAVATSLLRAAGDREHDSAALVRAADDRVRAYTLVVNAYQNVRDALAFLRRKERDVDQIAPSLFAGRGRRHKAAAPAPSPVTTTPTAPTSGAGAPVAAPPSPPTSASVRV